MDRTTKTLTVDVSEHRDDAEVRATLLHEMAHLAAHFLSRAKPGHNSAFFEQVERLLRLEAPITVGFPENQNRPHLDTVPARFRRCRAAMKKYYARQQRELEALERQHGKVHVIELADEFYEVGSRGVGWRSAVAAINAELGILDADDEPLPFFKATMKKVRAAHRRGMRDHRLLRPPAWALERSRWPDPTGYQSSTYLA
ncbi:MAG: SprT-like domain-containing protein [Myxococcaceae bacterium]|nr:SprT-like domain-containing protein [Myxococcaceae bacterium]